MECDESMDVCADRSIHEASCKILNVNSGKIEFFSSTTEQTQSTNTTPLADTKSCSRRNFDSNFPPSCKATLKFQTASMNFNEIKQKERNSLNPGKQDAKDAIFFKFARPIL
jgi:hypothetical protein